VQFAETLLCSRGRHGVPGSRTGRLQGMPLTRNGADDGERGAGRAPAHMAGFGLPREICEPTLFICVKLASAVAAALPSSFNPAS